MNFNDDFIIFTVTVGYFKKCVTFLLQQSSFCQTIIIFVESKGYNFKESQCTSLYLNSKIGKSKLNMAVFYPLADDRVTSRSCHLNNKKNKTKKTPKNKILRRRPTTEIKLKELSVYSERRDFIISSRAKLARSLLTARGLTKLQTSMPHKSMNICLVSANDVM